MKTEGLLRTFLVVQKMCKSARPCASSGSRLLLCLLPPAHLPATAPWPESTEPQGHFNFLHFLLLGESHNSVMKVIATCPEMNSIMPQLTVLYFYQMY